MDGNDLIRRALLFTAGEEAGGVDTESFDDAERAWMVAEANRLTPLDRSDEACPQCGGSMAGKTARAIYCKRQCQLDAREARRKADPHRRILHLKDGEYGSGRPIPACGVYGWTDTTTDPKAVTCMKCVVIVEERTV